MISIISQNQTQKGVLTKKWQVQYEKNDYIFCNPDTVAANSYTAIIMSDDSLLKNDTRRAETCLVSEVALLI